MKILNSAANTIHEWIYDIVCTLSYDRDYIYRSFVDHYATIMNGIFSGHIKPAGEHDIAGIKGQNDARITWELNHRLQYMGLNTVRFQCEIQEKGTKKVLETHIQEFELSNGERTL